MNTRVMKMAPKYECIHEDQIQHNSQDIERLKERSQFKEKQMDEMNTKLDKINEKLDDVILKSVKDDNNLKDSISEQDNRITALEADRATTRRFITIGLTIAGIIEPIAILIITQILH